MGKAREVFAKDLSEARVPSRFPDITNVEHGGLGDSVSFAYLSGSLPSGKINLEALIPELSEYPKSHEYMLFTSDNDVPPTFAAKLENLQTQLGGLGLCQMLDKVSRQLGRISESVGTGLSDVDVVQDSDEEEEDNLEQEEEEDDELDFDDDEVWSSHAIDHITDRKDDLWDDRGTLSASKTQKARIRSDLRKAKQAGFKVGMFGDFLGGGSNLYLSVSVRISKLGISEEALRAWAVDRRRHLVLLVHYVHGYRDLDQMIQDDVSRTSGVQTRVGICHSYKPSLAAAIQAFTKTVKHGSSTLLSPKYEEEIKDGDNFHLMFLSQSFRDLLNERLLKILRYRLTHGFGWGGAELFYNDNQCKNLNGQEEIEQKYYDEDRSPTPSALPSLVTADHVVEPVDKLSFPLVAIQFVLRHFARCTEFCLVCHCKVKTDFEALKPYVCDNGLCLFQYMSLGFGPSIEWEIMSQPHVVDLLISFCYMSARTGRLKDFPRGLHLQVPPLCFGSDLQPSSNPFVPTNLKGTLPKPSTNSEVVDTKFTTTINSWSETRIRAKMNPQTSELLFPDANAKCPVSVGEWIAIQDPIEGGVELHARVVDVSVYPTVTLASPVVRTINGTPNPQLPARWSGESETGKTWELDVYFNKYGLNFDEISPHDKRRSIMQILDTLPSVHDMKSYLWESRKQRSEPSLTFWNQRISPTALNVLRWIIASNRSCILHVDRFENKDTDSQQNASIDPEERVQGMSQWMQFRFAQGAPDKEQRFITAVKETQNRLRLAYPTIFAWHGSPLGNWHSIVREGLHFKEALHGRAYGNGVYMSNNAGTSLGYSGNNYSYCGNQLGNWPQSRLRISQALSLNEVVNAPTEFISSVPHYVVQHLDWIQTRYLFVQCTAPDRPLLQEREPRNAFPQDPTRVVLGENNTPLVIPITAVSKSRRMVTSLGPGATDEFVGTNAKRPNKKAKVEHVINGEQAQQQDDDANSVVTNDSDMALFDSTDDEDVLEIPKSEYDRLAEKGKNRQNDASLTDFIPNTLNIDKLPMLAPPSHANTMATKALQRSFRETLAVQESTPLHELGWYINPDYVTNMYQWIVELHSFDPKLPLAKDMKSKGLSSIVLELRFTNNFPFSPPFVRVIRPRFLPFLHGGGGHVTGGGALCMELLTSSGWSAVNSIESVLLQVRMAMSSTEPRPARLENRAISDYGIHEAVEAYVRACQQHGWQIPTGFTEFHHQLPSIQYARGGL